MTNKTFVSKFFLCFKIFIGVNFFKNEKELLFIL